MSWKKNPIEFLGNASFKFDLIDVKYEFSGLGNKFHDLPLNAKFLIEGLSVSLKQNNDHPINYYQRTSILFSEELSKPVELMTDFSINDIHNDDVVDHDHKMF